MSKKLLGLLEVGRKKLAGVNRSAFVREAIAEKLGRLGFPVEEEVLLPPDRIKGMRHAVVMETPQNKPVTEPRKEVKYDKPKRRRKTT